jgi:hypothetical protein
MRQLMSIIGIILMIFGIVTLGYQGFTYTQREKIAQLGDIEVTANQEKTVYFPPAVGGLSLIAGVILVIVGRVKK